jgi:heat shock protein HslJ
MAVGWSVALLVALAACGSEGGDDGFDDGAITAPTEPAFVWSAEALDGQTFGSAEVVGRELVPDTAIVLTFADGTLGASAGCNQMTGGYELEGTTLRWSQPATTMMGCEPELAAQDAWLSELLEGGVELRGETVVDGVVQGFVLSASELSIGFDAEASADDGDGSASDAILGRTWTLTSILEGETASSVPADVEPPTLEIAEDGTTTVFAGCNRGGTEVTVSDDATTMTFAPVALTRMACPDPAGAIEATVTQVLDGEVALSIAGDELTLTKGEAGLVFTAS